MSRHDLVEPCTPDCPPRCEIREAEVRRERAAVDGAWSELVLGNDGGGLRHFLAGDPVHCGTGLELQRRAERSDDWGEYYVWEQAGDLVRYEATFRVGEVRATLHVRIALYGFSRDLVPGMRFRWPVREP